MMRWIGLWALLLFGILKSTGSQKIDIAFIVDGSGSVYDTYPALWETQLSILEKIINDLNISPNDTHVAVVSYADTARVEWNLERYLDKQSLLSAIRQIRFDGGRSNLQDALMITWKYIFSGSPGDRANVSNVIVTLSDGIPTLNIENTSTTAEDIKAAGIMMSAIAIGRYPARNTLAYLSNLQTVYDETQLANQRIFANFVAKLREGVSQALIDPCASSPCLNGGICSASEDPYGWGYYCICPSGDVSGGRLCQIAKPCSSCPEGTWRCLRSISSDRGRFCFDRNYRLLD